MARRPGAGEISSSALSSRWSDEHVAIERIESLAGGVEAEAALAFVTNNDAGDLVVWSIDCVSFGHEFPVRRPSRRPLAVTVSSDQLGDGTSIGSVNNTEARQPSGNTEGDLHSRAGDGWTVSWATPFKGVHEDTRGTLAFDVAAQAASRNHRGPVQTSRDMVTIFAVLVIPNQSFLQSFFASPTPRTTPTR